MTNDKKHKLINMVDRSQIESKEEWMKIRREMPFMKFPAEWEVAIVPPYCGAVARFMVKKPNGVTVSVYADWYDALGYVGEPYWEMYPNQEGDTSRFAIADWKRMIEEIDMMRVSTELENG